MLQCNHVSFVMIEKEKGSYHPFSLIHYIALKSWLVNNPGIRVYLFTNMDLTESLWFLLLKDEFESFIEIKGEYFRWFQDTLNHINDFERVAHAADRIKYQILAEEKGLVSDTDYICMKPIQSLIDESKFNIPIESDPISYHPVQFGAALMYSPKSDTNTAHQFLKWHQDYKKGEPWAYYCCKYPYEKYLESDAKFKESIHLIPERLTDPLTWSKQRAADLFLHNRYDIDNGINYTFHVSESLLWDRFLKPLDLEHIMTVDTTFTRAVRKYVENLWDFKAQCPKVIEFA